VEIKSAESGKAPPNFVSALKCFSLGVIYFYRLWHTVRLKTTRWHAYVFLCLFPNIIRNNNNRRD